jgi:formamidopyrimidine-DNA glycosylase
MPELPEVETIKNYLHKRCLGAEVKKIQHFRGNLRWPIPDLTNKLNNLKIKDISRRAKYLILSFDIGHLIMHFGMSGYITCIDQDYENWLVNKKKHDHFVISLCMNDKIFQCILNDARRFGAVLWHEGDINKHFLLEKLGPEPLSDDFNCNYLKEILKSRKTPIKQAIMNGNIVVGVGNIYANEALFMSKINPICESKIVTTEKFESKLKSLVINIKKILIESIKSGGTTLKDYRQADGKPGYFKQTLKVYGRQGQPCVICGAELLGLKLGQRATVYCPQCQDL